MAERALPLIMPDGARVPGVWRPAGGTSPSEKALVVLAHGITGNMNEVIHYRAARRMRGVAGDQPGRGAVLITCSDDPLRREAAARYARALTTARNVAAPVTVIPGADHTFTSGDSVEHLLDATIDWLDQVVDQSLPATSPSRT